MQKHVQVHVHVPIEDSSLFFSTISSFFCSVDSENIPYNSTSRYILSATETMGGGDRGGEGTRVDGTVGEIDCGATGGTIGWTEGKTVDGAIGGTEGMTVDGTVGETEDGATCGTTGWTEGKIVGGAIGGTVGETEVGTLVGGIGGMEGRTMGGVMDLTKMDSFDGKISVFTNSDSYMKQKTVD